jgi:hypothetical protein
MEDVQGTAECQHDITDSLFPQMEPVFDDATTLDTPIALVASVADRHSLLQRQEHMHASAAHPSRECTSTTGGDHAPSILHTASACRVCFCQHYTRLPLLAYPLAKVSRVGTPENAQPARCKDLDNPMAQQWPVISLRRHGRPLVPCAGLHGETDAHAGAGDKRGGASEVGDGASPLHTLGAQEG